MIYADFNATTPLGKRARDEMELAFSTWGNPSSTHEVGRKALESLEKWRERVAKTAGCKPTELVFTSGGAESNGMALLGAAFCHRKDFRLLTSEVEHSSIRGAIPLFKDLGGEVHTVRLSATGELDMDDFRAKLTRLRPHMVSLMTANNETGVIFPIPAIARLCHENGVELHTDAVQGLGKCEPETWADADYVSLSAHKIFGPKGCGALIVRNGKQLVCTRFGGSQETKRRGGTQNMPGIAGFAGACSDLASAETRERVRRLRDRFEERVRKELDGVFVNGEKAPRTPNTSNLRFEGVTFDTLLPSLDLDGLCASSGSACSSGSITPSHVLIGMGLTPEQARESVRFSWSALSDEAAVDGAVEIIARNVRRIRGRREKAASAR